MLDVILLVGGMATRLREVTEDKIPKCLVDINGKPFIDYQLSLLNSQLDINRVVLATGRLSHLVEQHINKISDQYPFEIVISEEDEPLGTGGAMKKALDKVVLGRVLIMNGDVYNLIDYRDFTDTTFHRNMALARMHDVDRYGVVKVNKFDAIVGWEPKQHIDWGLINRGVYLFQGQLDMFDSYPVKFSFENDWVPEEIYREPIVGREMNGFFIDIGVPEDYNAFCKYVKSGNLNV